MAKRCIVIGASAGGYEAIKDIVSQLPADLPAPVFVVLHIAAYEPSLLPEILNNVGPLPAIHPEDGVRVQNGFVYVAPPDHHLLIDDGRIAVKKGPKENRFRPSIDALFRSAAYSYGPAAIGVILSGALDDGTAGLWSIKRFGGLAIVQDPYEAPYPSMPRSALEYVEADYKVKTKEISPLLVRLVSEPPPNKPEIESEMEGRTAKEVQIAAGVPLPQETILDFGKLSPFTCPECQGTLVNILEDKITRFRCHTGHAYSADALLASVTESIGEMMWKVTRLFQETVMVLEHIGQHMQDTGETDQAEILFAKANEYQKQAVRFQRFSLDPENLSTEKMERAEADD